MAQRDEESVGRRIHRLRTGLGLTQRELAAPTYTPGYVSAVESDRRTPSAEAMRHFAFRLGLDLEELATGRTADPLAAQELALLEAVIAGDRRRIATHASGPLRARALTDLAALTPDTATLHDEAALLAQSNTGRAVRTPDAATLYEEATTLLTDEPPHLRVEANAGRAVRLRRSGEFRYARHLLRTIRDELHESGHPDPAALVFVDAHLAACDVQVGDDSSPAAAEALALALPSPELSRDLHLRLARTLLAAGRFDDARLAVAQARAAHRQLGLRAELALCHQARARARQSAGDLSGAAADLGQSRAMLTAGGEHQAAADVGTELAGVHRELGNVTGARALLEDVLATAEPDTRTAARAHRQLGLLLLLVNESTAAERSLRTAVSIFERTGPGHDLARALLDLSDVLAPAAAAEALSAGLRSVERMARSATG
ncbi:helix-turn-helix transcriptional regulator [Amycolatopsis sp. NBC_01480]|uniref:helix-turn-helix transcriptional regulator n=1 Tax=Amycolatopsis sp. NBC_01480 TaxID=2903562 RepID=UPI002E2C0420|nr:helix-turn-helix transcriptional regulator [Amycolatopsis sp. NBC_01480]